MYCRNEAHASHAHENGAEESGEDDTGEDDIEADDSDAEASGTGDTSSNADQDVEDEVHSQFRPEPRGSQQAGSSHQQPTAPPVSKRARTDAGANAQSHCTYGAHVSDHAPQRCQDTTAYSSAVEQDNSAAYGQYTDVSLLGRSACNEGKDAIEQVRGAAHAVLPMLNADHTAEEEAHTQAGSRASVQTKRRQQPSSPLVNKKARTDADALLAMHTMLKCLDMPPTWALSCSQT